MAYLSNQNNEIIIDAVLTKYGREKLASQGSLGITKFALSDDEVDYSLYNVDHPMGTDFYDVAIVKMPTLEALPGNTLSMKYKLFTNRDTATVSSVSKLGVSEADPLVIDKSGVYYSFTPYVIPTVADDANLYYIAGVQNPNKLPIIFQANTDGKGISNEMAIVTNQFKSKSTSTLTYAVGYSFKILIKTLPLSPAILTVVLEAGGGAAVSTKTYNINISASTGTPVTPIS
jgi:hypothetical protein